MRIIFSIILIILFISCEDPTSQESAEPDREWTIVVYMAADGNLEEYAIDNFNEMERVNYAGSGVTVLALFDRIDGFDTSNGDWTDTRLYEIQTDTITPQDTDDNRMRSKRLNVPSLGLTTNTETELDTGNYLTLRNTLEFAKSEYSAKNYALMVWGHGSGWRSITAPRNRAIGFDETTNNSYMSNPKLRLALSGMDISIVSFDTCLGGVLELAYELKDEVERVIGSPDSISGNGWNYSDFFSKFIDSPKTIADFENAAILQFKNRYDMGPTQNAPWKNAISSMNTTYISDVKTALDTFSRALAVCITSKELSDMVYTILNKGTIYGTAGADHFIDIYAMIQIIYENIDDIVDPNNQEDLINAIDRLAEGLKKCITKSWKYDLEESYAMSVLFHYDYRNGLWHDPAYIQDSGEADQTLFVKESNGWVPTSDRNKSLLDKLFHQTTW